METHSSILTWKIPWTEESSRLQSMELKRVSKEWWTKHKVLPLSGPFWHGPTSGRTLFPPLTFRPHYLFISPRHASPGTSPTISFGQVLSTLLQIVGGVVQLLGLVRLFATPWTVCSTPGFSVLRNLQRLLKLVSIESVMPANHFTLCHALLLPSTFLSIRVFSNELALPIRKPKYWSFSFNISISVSNECSGLISFRIDWFDLLAVQGTLKSLFLHHSSKASVSLALSLLYHLALISLQDYWKKLYLWLDGPLSAKWWLCFLICCLGLPQLFFQGASVF